MPGKPQYKAAEIIWILKKVVAKKKNAAIQAKFEKKFHRPLGHNQLRYVKTKYGRSSDFNSPLVNMRPGQTSTSFKNTSKAKRRRTNAAGKLDKSPQVESKLNFGDGSVTGSALEHRRDDDEDSEDSDDDDDEDGGSVDCFGQRQSTMQRHPNPTIQSSCAIQPSSKTIPSSLVQPPNWKATTYPNTSPPMGSDPNLAQFLSTPNASPGPAFTNSTSNMYTQQAQQRNWQQTNQPWDMSPEHVHGLPLMASSLSPPSNFNHHLNSTAPYVSSPLAQRAPMQREHTPAEQHKAFGTSSLYQFSNPTYEMQPFDADFSRLAGVSLAHMAAPYQQQQQHQHHRQQQPSQLPVDDTLWSPESWLPIAPYADPTTTRPVEELSWLDMPLPGQDQVPQLDISAPFPPQTHSNNTKHTASNSHAATPAQKALQQEQAAGQRRHTSSSGAPFTPRSFIVDHAARHIVEPDLPIPVTTKFPSPSHSSPVNPIVKTRSAAATPASATIDPQLLISATHPPVVQQGDSLGPSPREHRRKVD